MSRCDSCASVRTCGFRDDWTEECYNYIGEEVKHMELDAKAVGKRLRELRGFDKSQEAVSAELGISRASLCLYENGLRIPGGEIATQLAHYYDTTTDYIFLGKK